MGSSGIYDREEGDLEGFRGSFGPQKAHSRGVTTQRPTRKSQRQGEESHHRCRHQWVGEGTKEDRSTREHVGQRGQADRRRTSGRRSGARRKIRRTPTPTETRRRRRRRRRRRQKVLLL